MKYTTTKIQVLDLEWIAMVKEKLQLKSDTAAINLIIKRMKQLVKGTRLEDEIR